MITMSMMSDDQVPFFFFSFLVGFSCCSHCTVKTISCFAKECEFTANAMIIDIENGFGWSYLSCNACSRKLQIEATTYVCNHCNPKCKYPVLR